MASVHICCYGPEVEDLHGTMQAMNCHMLWRIQLIALAKDMMHFLLIMQLCSPLLRLMYFDGRELNPQVYLPRIENVRSHAHEALSDREQTLRSLDKYCPTHYMCNE